MKLSTKLLLTTCVPPALIWVVGFYVERVSEEKLRGTIKEAATSEVRSVEEQIDQLLRMRVAYWETYGGKPLMQQALRDSNARIASEPDLETRMAEIERIWRGGAVAERRNLVEELLDEPLSEDMEATLGQLNDVFGHEVYVEAFVTNARGRIVAQTEEVSAYSHDQEGWWQEVWQEGESIGEVTFDEEQDLVSIEFCRRIEDDEGHYLGVLKAEMSLAEVFEIVDAHAKRGGPDRRLALLTGNGQLIRLGARGMRPLADGRRYLVKPNIDDLAGRQFEIPDNMGREQVFTYADRPEGNMVTKLGWVVVQVAEADAVLGPVQRLRSTVIVITLVATAIGMTVMLWIVVPVSWRMKRMADATKEIGRGNLETRISVTGRDELSQLSHEFNRMTSRLEDARAELMVAMRRAKEASQAKGDFLANMSHEIRTPMNAILGMTELTLGTPLTDEQREYQILVEQSAGSLLMLLNDILDFSKIEAGALELEEREFDLRDSIGDILQTLSPRASDKGLELAFRAEAGIPGKVEGDLGRLRQVIMNLVGNAIKFTEEGEILVSVLERERRDGQIELQFSVRDSGIGVPVNRHDTIFEVFAQADSSTTREFGGTGLGLAISKRIVEKMGGEIWVESKEGEGSTFRFTGLFGVGAEASGADQALMGSLQGMPVLVVDDNATSRQIVGDMLKNWKMTEILCSNAESAMSKLSELESKGEGVKLVLLDRSMPKVDGFQLAGRIHGSSKWSKLPLILLSCVSGSGKREEREELGIVKVVNKPVKQSILLDAIMQATGIGMRTRLPPREKFGERPESVPDMNVLLAEDGKLNQIVAVRLLERRGHRVTVASTGQAAVELSESGDFDVVLMDIQMPVMSGFEASRAIRERERGSERHQPVIAMTAHAMPGDREECLAAGMDDYISKPIESSELYAVVEQFAPLGNDAKGQVGEGQSRVGEAVDSPSRELVTFDPDGFRNRIGDESLMCELIEIFEEESAQLIRDVRNAGRRGGSAEMHDATHRLKGVVGNYCAERAMDYVTRLDARAQAGELVGAEELVEALTREVEHLEVALRAFREKLEKEAMPS